MTEHPILSVKEKTPYLRWHPARPDNISFRGDNLDALNKGTFALIHEQALKENAERGKA